MRTGLICKKLGMSRIFDSNGSHIPVTVLHLDNCHVISSITEETKAMHFSTISSFMWISTENANSTSNLWSKESSLN